MRDFWKHTTQLVLILTRFSMLPPRKGGLERTLLWKTPEKSSTSFGQIPLLNARHREKYYAPSWSWASVTGDVKFIGQKMDILWSIMDASFTLASPEKLGLITGGYVSIQGPLAKVKVERKHSSINEQIKIKYGISCT
jgi:hypothetical protein